MTAETSNARGELRMADIREDAREPLQLLREKLVHDEDGWAALCQLMPMIAAAPPPAAAQQQEQAAPPSAPVGVEASYHPCTSILIEGLKRLEGGSDVLAEWDRARAKADAALAQQPAAVDEARGVVDVYTMQTIADAAAALDKRGDRQMAARLIRLHTRLLATQHQEPKS